MMGTYLDLADRVLDVGAGNCILCQELDRLGYHVVPVDLQNLSFVDEIVPVIYDGMRLPFDDDSFDVALVITVLHHAPDPDAVLAEVSIVARRIIVIEEIYGNGVEKYFTYAVDSLFNLEFFSHPHSSRTDSEWRKAFQETALGCRRGSLLPLAGSVKTSHLPMFCCGLDDGTKASLFRSPLRLRDV